MIHFFVVICLCEQSSVCAKIMEKLGQSEVESRQRQVIIIGQDSFYRNLTPEEHHRAVRGNFNFDHPGKH